MMNISPPMVGVPCFDMCQVGPISLMDCPAFMRRSRGMSPFPPRAAAAKATTKLITILNISFATSKASQHSKLRPI